MLLLITYDLNRPGQKYDEIHEAIKSAGYWWHHLESTWLVQTSNGPKYWYEKLEPYLDSNDHLLIIEVKNNYWGTLPKRAWEWISGAFFRG